MTFWAYMLHCRGGAYYTGHADDLEKRIADHQSGLIEGFASKRLPVELVWSQDFPTRIEALEAERRIKGWSRNKKMALIRGDWGEISRLAKSKDSASASSARTALVIGPDVIGAIKSHAADSAPNECCGLLLGESERIAQAVPAANVAEDPARRFEIDPLALLAAHKAARAGGPQVLGYYHSHPDGHPVPSATDCEHSSGDGRVWAIVAAGEVTFWRDGEQGFEPVSYSLAQE